MFCRLFLLPFLLFCFVGCVFCEHVNGNDGTAAAVIGDSVKSVFFLKEVPESDAMLDEATIKKFYTFSFLTADNLLMALAAVNGAEHHIKNMELFARCNEISKEQCAASGVKSNSDDENRNAQQVAYEMRNSINYSIKDMMAVAKGDKMYLLMVKGNEQKSNENWDFVFVEDTVTIQSSTTLNFQSNIIQVANTSAADKFKEKIQDAFLYFVYASVTAEKNVVFVLGGTSNENKNVFSIFLLKSSEAKLDLVHIFETSANCHPTFFLWGNKMVIVFNDCKDNNDKKIKEIDIAEKELKDAEGLFAHLLNISKDKKTIVSVTVNDVPVLLFTEKEKSEESQSDVLWMTDGNRTSKVGPVITEIEKDFFGPITFLNNKLFPTYEQYTYNFNPSETKKKGFFALLKEQEKKISSVLEVWNKSNKNVLELCKQSSSVKVPCVTDGLVGFLSNNAEVNDKMGVWQDEYLYINATVNGGTKATNGLKFNGAGAGATWPVGKKEEEQPYNLLKNGFTLVATVSAEQIENYQKNSLLGVCMGDDKKCVGLWCTKEGEFVVTNGEKQAEIKLNTDVCKQNKAFQVWLILQKEGNMAIHIYDDKLYDLSAEEIQFKETDDISHIYFGAVNLSEEETKPVSHVTVTNVLLYSRLFTAEEIKEITAKKEEIPLPAPETKEVNIPQDTGSEDGILQTPEIDQGVTNKTTNTSNLPIEEEENISSMSRLQDSAVLVGVDVFSLLLGVWTVLLCVREP